jgi:serine protease Do
MPNSKAPGRPSWGLFARDFPSNLRVALPPATIDGMSNEKLVLRALRAAGFIPAVFGRMFQRSERHKTVAINPTARPSLLPHACKKGIRSGATGGGFGPPVPFGKRSHSWHASSAIILTLLLTLPTALHAQDADGLAAASAIERTFVDVIRRVEPSVVSVARIRPSPTLNHFNPFEGDLDGRSESNRPESADFVPNEFGAGIVVAPLPGSDECFILTNYHVVRGGPAASDAYRAGGSEIYVRCVDRRGYYARILAADPRSDLAVLAIDYQALGVKPGDLKPIRLRSERTPLQRGQLVLTLGNPYAIARDGAASASWGMISNIARRPATIRPRDPAALAAGTIHQFGTLIQVDSHMELGTSGGALVNLRGELVGITTALAALEGYEKSVGFAIPIDDFARRVIETLCRGYEVEYGFLGLTPETLLPDQLRRYSSEFKQASAIRVQQVIANSPAANGHIQLDDIILEIEGHPLLDRYDLMRYVGMYGPEALIRLKIWRPRDAHELTLSAKLGKWPVVDDDAIIATSQRFAAWRGITVDYPTGRSKYFGWPYQFKDAVLVTNVAARSPAQSAGLTEGDFIASVGGTPVHTPAEFYEAVRRFDGEVTLELTDRRRITVVR